MISNNNIHDLPSPFETSPPQVQPESCMFTVGDIVWAKVNLHPWWPCMISTPNLSNAINSRQAQKYLDESISTHSVEQGDNFIRYMNASRRHKRMLYVEFFGPMVEHAWAIESNVVAYSSGDPTEFFKGICCLTAYLNSLKMIIFTFYVT